MKGTNQCKTINERGEGYAMKLVEVESGQYINLDKVKRVTKRGVKAVLVMDDDKEYDISINIWMRIAQDVKIYQ